MRLIPFSVLLRLFWCVFIIKFPSFLWAIKITRRFINLHTLSLLSAEFKVIEHIIGKWDECCEAAINPYFLFLFYDLSVFLSFVDFVSI